VTLNIDQILLEQDLSDKIGAQVETLFETHGHVFPIRYALSWVLANQVVQHHYGSQGLDALPVWRENYGWAQFSLKRAQNCFLPPNPAEETQRYIVFDAIAVNWCKQYGGNEIQYDLLTAIEVHNQPPQMAIGGALLHLGLDDAPLADHSACLHSHHAYTYTKLFEAVTNLICQAPEMVAKREIIVDLDSFGHALPEPVHPLRRAGLVEAGTHHDWFELFYVPANRCIFVNVFTGDLCYTEANNTPRALEYPGWNELNEEQLTTYLGGLLAIPDKHKML